MTDDRVRLGNPITGREGVDIARTHYEPVKRAILDAVAEGDPTDRTPLRLVDLTGRVAERTDPRLWLDASVDWYTVAIAADLEFRGLVQPVPGSSPQRLRLTTPGRIARSA